MDKLQNIRGVAFDLDGTLVDSAPGLAAAVDMALYALELPVAGEERVITWIGNGADVLMERALAWAREERAALRKTMGKPPVDEEIPAEEQVRILRKTVRQVLWRCGGRGHLFISACRRHAGRAARQRIAIRSGD
nr:phosphoglycolate phosphatase [Salmonella sp. NCTC 7297]